MSMERIAEILCVDEVMVNHGPKGVAVHVRIDQKWHSVAIDHDQLVKSRGHGDDRTERQRRLESIAEHIVYLADANIGKVRDPRKARSDAATRAALQAEQLAQQRRGAPSTRMLSWADVGGFDRPRDGLAQQQLSKSETTPPPALPPDVVTPDGPAAESMPSRFHAIMAELRCL